MINNSNESLVNVYRVIRHTPYKPVNEAGACIAYMPDDFDDDCQIELAGLCKDWERKVAKECSSTQIAVGRVRRTTYSTTCTTAAISRGRASSPPVCSIAEKRETVDELLIRNY